MSANELCQKKQKFWCSESISALINAVCVVSRFRLGRADSTENMPPSHATVRVSTVYLGVVVCSHGIHSKKTPNQCRCLLIWTFTKQAFIQRLVKVAVPTRTPNLAAPLRLQKWCSHCSARASSAPLDSDDCQTRDLWRSPDQKNQDEQALQEAENHGRPWILIVCDRLSDRHLETTWHKKTGNPLEITNLTFFSANAWVFWACIQGFQ